MWCSCASSSRTPGRRTSRSASPPAAARATSWQHWSRRGNASCSRSRCWATTAERSGGRGWPTSTSWSAPTTSRGSRRSRRRSTTSSARAWRRCAMPRVELFGTATCPYTRDLREWLELRGTEFDEYDVELDADARERMRTLTAGERTVPVLVEDGRVVQVGWQGRGCTVGG